MRNVLDKAIDAATNDGSTAVTSDAIDGGQLMAISVQATFSDSAAAGAVTLEGSNDAVASTWSTVPSTSQTVTAGAAVLVPRTEVTYRWLRVKFVPSAGAGTLTATIFAQGF